MTVRSELPRNKNGFTDDLCSNWIAHMSLLEAFNTHKIALRCPACGKTHEYIGWTCCGLSVEEASNLVHEEYMKRCITKQVKT
jgi:hypothetical protein